MALNVFRASALRTFIESALRVRETDVPAPPVGDFSDFPCQVLMYQNVESSSPGDPLFKVCNSDPVNWCPDTTFVAVDGYGLYTFVLRNLARLPDLENLPIEITDSTGTTIFTIPATNCPSYGTDGYAGYEWLSPAGRVFLFFERAQDPNPLATGYGIYFRVHVCAPTLISLPAESTILGCRITNFGADVGSWPLCGDILSIEQVDQGLYPPVVQYTGDTLLPSLRTRDQQVLLIAAGVYSGSHLITSSGAPTFTLTDTTWQGDVTTGTWVNNAVEIDATGLGLPFFDVIVTVDGVAGTYDGDYTPIRITADRFLIEPKHFVGTDSGTVQRWGIIVNITGLPSGYSRFTDVSVSGTGLYDGIHNCRIREQGGGAGTLDLFDLGDTKFIGSATGTYEVVDEPIVTGLITSIAAAYSAVAFSSVVTDAEGSIVEIRSAALRVVTNPGHNVIVGDDIRLLKTFGTIYGSSLREVIGVIGMPSISFDLKGTYSGHATGTWTGGPNAQ